MFCTECGKKVADTAKFCANCGTKLINEEIVTEINTEVRSDANADDSENGDPGEIVSFFKSDPNYFGDLSNEVVIKAAENGNMYAQKDMARRCETIDDDNIGAYIWYKMALPARINIAKQGDFEERISLGKDYKYGLHGAEENETESDYWFKTAFDDCMKAAEQGDAIAQCNLGTCFRWGYGTNEDIEEAIYWFEKATKLGNTTAMLDLKCIYEDDTSEVHDKHKADYWEEIYDKRCAEKTKEEFHKLKEAAEQGDACKQHELAGRYFHGNGVEKNTEAADLWAGRAFSGFKKAAEQGDARAQTWLGNCYWHGNGVQKDRQTALMWYKKAAEQGNNEAMERISGWYHIEKNDYEHRHWLKKAAEQGNAKALFLLSLQKGRKDLEEILERSKDIEEKRKNVLDALNKNPRNEFLGNVGSLLNDVDISEVMKNPKEAVVKFGFNVVRKMFEENVNKKK